MPVMQAPRANIAVKESCDQVWGIQDFAAIFEVTPRTVRFYEDKGLLSPDRQAGSRIFSEQDHVRFSEILRAKRLGFSLDDIKVVFDVIDGKVTDRSELLQHKDNFEAVIKSLRRRRKDIDTLTQDMTEICNRIDEIASSTSDTISVLQFADAYDAVFRRHLAEDEFDPQDTN